MKDVSKYKDYLTETIKEAKSWLEPINEQTTTIQVQMKKGNEIVFTKNYNSQDVQKFYNMKENEEPIIFDKEVKSLESAGPFRPYIIGKIDDSNSGSGQIIIYLKESRNRMMYFVK